MNWQLNSNDQCLIDLALKEDLHEPYFDATSHLLFSNKQPYTVKIVSKHASPIVVSGMPVVQALMQRLKAEYDCTILINESERAKRGDTICILKADAASLLMAERTLLNFLRHLSAIATLAAAFVEAVKGSTLKILDTRKTTPGMRHLEKYAVQCGGGVNHRMGLYDAILIKDNHVDLLGGMKNALDKLPTKPNYPVVVEVRSQAELEIVLKESRKRVERVLLDNMTLEELGTCVKMCRGHFTTEASGNITLDTIRAIAETGVDFASIGAITHSAGHVDLSMQVCS